MGESYEADHAIGDRCGECDSCLEHGEGFVARGIGDPDEMRFPAPISEAMREHAVLMRVEADWLDQMADKVEELEAIKEGVSHPLGCFLADDMSGMMDFGWYKHPDCKLEHLEGVVAYVGA